MSKSLKLVFREIVILLMIQKLYEENDTPPTLLQLVDPRDGQKSGKVNEFIAEINDIRYGEPISSSSGFATSIAKLRDLGFLKKEKKLKVSAKGKRFLKDIGPDWQKYPIVIPIVSNKLIMEEARYIENHG